jgi:hypothetical protein
MSSIKRFIPVPLAKACDKEYVSFCMKANNNYLGQNLKWPHMNFLKTNFLQH